MDFTQKPWWRTDNYLVEEPASPLADLDVWGPAGPALSRVWINGKTQPGWGEEQFMQGYLANKFQMKPILHGYNLNRWTFAWIMRSCRLICIDIDGKNGGLDHASELGFLPPTVAETSKSGSGYHLFYTVEDTWHGTRGFAGYNDHIGIVTGVDIRGTGCVFHHPQQRWNTRQVAPLPKQLQDKLGLRAQRRVNAEQEIIKRLDLGPEEVAMLKDELIEELNQKIPVGKRNVTLFAVGCKLKLGEVDNWPELVRARAEALGLDDIEIDKLIENIEKYATA